MGQNKAVIFELDRVLYALDILEVQEIIRMIEITPLAETDPSLEGIVNLRGNVIPVISLCRKLGLNQGEYDGNNRIIVTEYNNKRIGMVVDRVLEVGSFADEDVEQSDQIIIANSYLKGIIKKDKKLWLLLNLSELHR